MWYLTLHRFTGQERPGKDVIDEHIKWMAEQKRTGKMLVNGPSGDRSTGIVVYGPMPEDELRKVLDTDPLIVSGLREYKVYPWEVHHVDLESITTLVSAAHA